MAQGRSLGFGFLIGAKDDGATRTTEQVSEGFSGIAEGVSRTVRESAGLQRFGNMINALSLNRLNQISESLEGLADRAGALAGEVTSTSMESFGAEFSQTYRAATAGLGVFQGAVDEVRGEISSLSFNLGVDATEMTAYAATVARTGRNVEDFGLNMRAVAGSIQAGILSGQDLGNVLTGLAEGYDLGTEGAARLLDRVTAIGERFGSGADAARAMPEVLSAIDEVASRFPEIGENVDTATESIIRLGLAEQQRLGGTFQDGVQNAINVFNQLGETRGEVEGLVSGLNSEFPTLAARIAEIGGIDMSMDSIMQDPVRFAASMASMYNQLEPNSVEAMRLRDVLQGMGPSFQFLIQGGEESERALAAAMETIEGTEGAFNRMARAASGSTRTFAESMELLEEGFRHRVDRMARRHYPNFERNVIERQREAYDRLEERIRNFTDSKGPMGAMGRSFLAFRRGGVQGLAIALETELSRSFPRLGEAISDTLPVVGDMAGEMLDMASNAFPAIAAMQSLGINTRILAAPLRLATNPLVLFGLGLYALVRYWDRLEPLMRKGVIYLEGFADKFESFVDSIDWDKAGQDLIGGILSMFDNAGDAIGGSTEESGLASRIGVALGRIFRAAGRAARGAIRGMWTELVGWITQPEDLTGQVQRGAAVLGTTLAAAMVSPIRGPIMSAMSGIFGSLGQAGGLIGRGVGGAARLVGRAGLRAIPGIGAILGVLFDLPDIIQSFNTDGIVGGLRTTFSSIMNGLLLGIPQAVESLTGTTVISDIFNRVFDLTNIEGVITAIQGGDYMRAAVEAMFGGAVGNIFQEYVQENFGTDIFGSVTSGLQQVFANVGAVFSDLATTWMTHGAPLFDAFMTSLREIGAIATELWTSTLQPTFMEVYNLLSEIATDVLGMLFGETNTVGTAFEGVTAAVSVFGSIINAVIATVGPVMRWLGEAILPIIVFGFQRAANNIQMMATAVRVVVQVVQVVWQVLRPIVGLIADIGRGLMQVPRLFTDFSGAVEDLGAYFQELGFHITNFWYDRVVPAFEYMGEVWSEIGQAIWGVARSIFNSIGQFVGSIIDAIVGYYRFMWNTWSSVADAIWNAGRQVFEAVAAVARSAFDRIVQAIANVQERWRIARAMLATGFELIGAKITQFFLRPVLRVRNNFTNMIDRLREGFLSVKVAVLEMYRAIFDRIARIDILPDSIQNTFRNASEGIDNMISRSNQELTTLRTQQLQNQAEMAQQEAAIAADVARLNAEAAAQRAAMSAVGTESGAGGRPRVPATEDRPVPTQPQDRQRRREDARTAAQANQRRPQPVVIAGVDQRAAGALSPTVNVQAPGPGRGRTRRRGGAGEDRADQR